VRDHRIDLDLSVMYQSTIFGTSVRPRAPPNAVPFPDPPVTELERPGCNFLAGLRDPDHHGDAQPRWQASSA